ncbi:MAG: twin-arginine translocation signal domain-containing protein [Planctomycetaceae bacterium]
MIDLPLERRDFLKHASAGAAGLLTAGRWEDAAMAAGPDRNSSSTRLVLLGLNALARAPERNYFADGHRGASLVAAHLLCVENQLDEPARQRISQLLELNWASTPLCGPFPEADADIANVGRIGDALMAGSDALREVGHNAIFAMLAIKAFRMLPEAATPQRIDGVCRLIESFVPWRDMEPDADIDLPPFVETAAASRFILREANEAIDRFAGYGQGFTGHLLTFGHALVELAAMGDVEWAESCRLAFRKYVTVVRRGPDSDAKRIADHAPSRLRPRDAKYWQNRGDHAVDIGHVFKYPYSYYDLLRTANDPELSQALEAKAFQLF